MSGWVTGVLGVAGLGMQAYGMSQQPGSVDGYTDAGRPLGVESIFAGLSLEALQELGVPYEALEEEVLMRGMAASGKSGKARQAMKTLNKARVAYQQLKQGGTPRGGQVEKSLQKNIDNALKKFNNVASQGGAQASLGPDGIQLSFLGPNASTLAQLKANGAQQEKVKDNRDAALNRLSEIMGSFARNGQGQIPAEDDASRYLNTFLDENYANQSTQIMDRSNKLGISPGGQLGELDKALQYERARISSGGALERALALANAEQGFLKTALEPAGLKSTLAASQQTSQDSLAAAALSNQIAIANAEAQSARAAGYAGLGSALTGSAGSLYSSSKLADELGGGQPDLLKNLYSLGGKGYGP